MKRPALVLYTHPKTGALRRRRWQLHVIEGVDAGLVLELHEPRAVLGAALRADLRMFDPTVAYHHLEIQVFADGLALRDLDTTNGSFLGDDERFRQVFVSDGQAFRVGAAKLQVVACDESADSEIETDPRGIPAPGEIEHLGAALGVAASTRELLGTIRKVAASISSVLFFGEAGTGKATFARALHEMSPRRNHPFVLLDLRDKESFAIESEIFGLGDDVPSGFERAHRGTLFIKDIDRLSSSLQDRVLQTLDRGEVRRSGAKMRRRVDVRLVSSTRIPDRPPALDETFFRRISGVRMRAPSLRDRADDIPALTRQFLADLGHPNVAVGPRTLTVLEAQAFDRNVDQLRIAVEAAFGARSKTSGEGTGTLRASRASSAQTSGQPPSANELAEPRDASALREALIADTVAVTGGDITKAAAFLSMTQHGLFRWLDEQGFDLESLSTESWA
ncbi:MAG: sigma 54-dependent Fis family transcriptional regulator [Deltaproteobacteria bacterium]|nr:sigma 54-dependent Fis family transcriptional regulator [Deltaproteobacteria bacterium]